MYSCYRVIERVLVKCLLENNSHLCNLCLAGYKGISTAWCKAWNISASKTNDSGPQNIPLATIYQSALFDFRFQGWSIEWSVLPLRRQLSELTTCSGRPWTRPSAMIWSSSRNRRRPGTNPTGFEETGLTWRTYESRGRPRPVYKKSCCRQHCSPLWSWRF